MPLSSRYCAGRMNKKYFTIVLHTSYFALTTKFFQKATTTKYPWNKPKALGDVDFDKVECIPPQRKAKVKLHRSRIIFLGQWHHRDCKKCQALQERWKGNPIHEWRIPETQKINSQAQAKKWHGMIVNT